MTVVLDSWVIIRYLEDAGPAAGAVADLLESERPVVSWINLGEVFYVVRRAAGEDAPIDTLRDVQDVTTPDTPNPSLIIDAARLKSEHPMAYADAFAAATAIARGATLWTGDPELLSGHLAGADRWGWRRTSVCSFACRAQVCGLTPRPTKS